MAYPTTYVCHMSGHNEGTIAALLRHSTTALVKRYAHLSPTHLRNAVETVATFGQDDQIANPNRDINRKCHPERIIPDKVTTPLDFACKRPPTRV